MPDRPCDAMDVKINHVLENQEDLKGWMLRHEKRIQILERHKFAFYVVGPVLLGLVAFLTDIQKLFGKG